MSSPPDQHRNGGTSRDSDLQLEVNATASGCNPQAAQTIINKFKMPRKESSDPDDVYQYLKKMMQKNYEKMNIRHIHGINTEDECPLENYCVDLTVTSKRSPVVTHLNSNQLKEIFSPVANKIATRILVVGQAGYGKSTFALKLCYDFAKGETYISQYELVILLRLREFKSTSFDEMLAAKLKLLLDCSLDTAMRAVKKNQQSTLIILDGYDETDKRTRDHLNPLLKSERLPKATVILIARTGIVQVTEDYDKIVEIKGVTGNSRCQFLQQKMQSCSQEQQTFLKDVLYAKFDIQMDEKWVENKSFRSYFAISCFEDESRLLYCPPFLSLILAFVKYFYPDSVVFTTKTELFKKLLKFCAQTTMREPIHSKHVLDLFEFDIANPPSCVRALSLFGQLALKALITKDFSFTKDEILSQCNGDDFVLHLGLLTENDSVELNDGQQTSWFQPIHSNILEFFAAYHLWFVFKCQTSNIQLPTEFLPELSGKTEYIVLPFLAGLCGDELQLFFSKLETESFPDDTLRRLAHSGTFVSESTLNGNLISEALLPLMPAVWYMSHFKHRSCRTTELLQEIVAEAGSKGVLQCLVHDSLLPWDICKGRDKVTFPLIVLTTNSTVSSFQNTFKFVRCYEIRVFLDSFINVDDIGLRPPSFEIISFVESETSHKAKSFLRTDGSFRGFPVYILKQFLPQKLTVEWTSRKECSALGKTVGMYTPLHV